MLKFSEACERNKEPILQVLQSCFSDRSHVLEIGSGSGQHAVYFASHLPHLIWQPTERAQELASLNERVQLARSPNLQPAIELDVGRRPWPSLAADAIFSANTFHIMSWEDVVTLLQRAAELLPPAGVLAVYGPFHYGGEHTADSNRQFDISLKRRDPLSGIRDAQEVQRVAGDLGLKLEADHAMPANNRVLVFRKAAD